MTNEIYCDLNARMDEKLYSLERNGTVIDLEKLGLTLESSVGMRFRFFSDDLDDDNKPDDIMFDGIVVLSEEWGYCAQQESEIFWRSNLPIK